MWILSLYRRCIEDMGRRALTVTYFGQESGWFGVLSHVSRAGHLGRNDFDLRVSSTSIFYGARSTVREIRGVIGRIASYLGPK